MYYAALLHYAALMIYTALPNQELSEANTELQRETVYVHLIGRSANYPIILHYEECKYTYVCMLINEASTKKKYEVKMHIETRKTIFLRLFE